MYIDYVLEIKIYPVGYSPTGLIIRKSYWIYLYIISLRSITNIAGIPIAILAGIPEHIFRSYTAGQKLDVFRSVYNNIISADNDNIEIIEVI